MIFINNKKIYNQIVDNISEKVINGIFSSGDKIPSVRKLAQELGVNPNTVLRAYGEMQSLQIIDNKRGVGYFVNSKSKQIILENKRREFFKRILPDFVHQARLLDISYSDLKKAFWTI